MHFYNEEFARFWREGLASKLNEIYLKREAADTLKGPFDQLNKLGAWPSGTSLTQCQNDLIKLLEFLQVQIQDSNRKDLDQFDSSYKTGFGLWKRYSSKDFRDELITSARKFLYSCRSPEQDHGPWFRRRRRCPLRHLEYGQRKQNFSESVSRPRRGVECKCWQK